MNLAVTVILKYFLLFKRDVKVILFVLYWNVQKRSQNIVSGELPNINQRLWYVCKHMWHVSTQEKTSNLIMTNCGIVQIVNSWTVVVTPTRSDWDCGYSDMCPPSCCLPWGSSPQVCLYKPLSSMPIVTRRYVFLSSRCLILDSFVHTCWFIGVWIAILQILVVCLLLVSVHRSKDYKAMGWIYLSIDKLGKVFNIFIYFSF